MSIYASAVSLCVLEVLMSLVTGVTNVTLMENRYKPARDNLKRDVTLPGIHKAMLL